MISLRTQLRLGWAIALVASFLLTAQFVPNNAHANTAGGDYQSGYRAYQAGNYEMARAQWRLAAQNDDPRAQYALGLLYYRGNTGPANYEEAAKWFMYAAQANHAGAIYYIGVLYFNGWGLNYDQFRATEYFKRALRAAPNNSNAAYLIGAQYYHGRGAQQNYVEAAHYFEIAAKGNMHAAQFMLGAMYERGWGIAQNYAESYYWLTRAARGKITFPPGAEEKEKMDAKAAVTSLEPRLRPEEIKRVHDRLKNEAAQ